MIPRTGQQPLASDPVRICGRDRLAPDISGGHVRPKGGGTMIWTIVGILLIIALIIWIF